MRVPCTNQLPRLQLKYVKLVSSRGLPGHRLPLGSSVAARAKKEQKNEGVYFEYEAVDPDAMDEIAALQEEDEQNFTWARRSREQKKIAQDRYRKIERHVLGAKTPDARRKGGKNRKGLSPAERRQVAAEAAAAAASKGPVLASFSPVETPAMVQRAVTPEDKLQRPTPPRPVPPAATDKPAADAAEAAAAPASSGTETVVSQSPQQSSPSTSEAKGELPTTVAAGSDGLDGSAAAGAAAAAAVGAGRDRRQRLLQRMKGSSGAADSGSSKPALAAGTEAAAKTAGATGPVGENAPTGGRTEAGATSAAGTQAPTSGAAAAAATAAAAAAAAAAAVGAAAAAEIPQSSSQAADDGDDLDSPMLAPALPGPVPPDIDLPPAEALPAEARPARELLASILNPSAEELREVTGGDVADMLQRDLEAQKEFSAWVRSARSGRAAAASTSAGEDAGDQGLGLELSEQEVADLEAALAALGDLDPAELEALGLGGDGEGEEEMELGLDDEIEGNADAAAAMAEVAELRSLMAALDAADKTTEAADATEVVDMTDEQVLADLKVRDPVLYELLKDVPEFDKLNLDEALDLNLDLAGPDGQLSEAELAELAAEAEAAGSAAGGGEDAEELEGLLREMRGMGLMREGGGANAEDDDDDDDDEADEGDVALGDLLEAIDEDEELDPTARMKAQFALQSMFNQPADEVAAKGTRGSAGAQGGVGAGEGAGTGAGGQPTAATPPPPPLRGTTGMARGAVSADDEDGGAAPPPLLPRPKPKRR